MSKWTDVLLDGEELTEEELQAQIDWFFDAPPTLRGMRGKRQSAEYLRGYRSGWITGRRAWRREQKAKRAQIAESRISATQ